MVGLVPQVCALRELSRQALLGKPIASVRSVQRLLHFFSVIFFGAIVAVGRLDGLSWRYLDACYGHRRVRALVILEGCLYEGTSQSERRGAH